MIRVDLDEITTRQEGVPGYSALVTKDELQTILARLRLAEGKKKIVVSTVAVNFRREAALAIVRGGTLANLATDPRSALSLLTTWIETGEWPKAEPGITPKPKPTPARKRTR